MSTNEQSDQSKGFNRTEEDYLSLEMKDQIFASPNMWVGSITLTEMKEWIAEEITDPEIPFIMEKREFMCSEALIRMFIEILSNATDNAIETKQKGDDPGVIQIFLSLFFQKLYFLSKKPIII